MKAALRALHQGRTVFHDLGRYALCGGLAGGTDFGSYWLMTRFLGVHPLAANLISRPLGGLVSFLANKHWTFRYRGQRTAVHAQFARFWLVWLASYGLSELFLAGYLRAFPGRHMLPKLLAEATVAVLTFFGQRHWTFR